MSKNTSIPFPYSHIGANDFDFWFHLRPLEETEIIFKYGAKLISEAGMHWDRVHLPGIFSWNVIEPVKGKYDWTIPDTLVKAAQSHNVNLLPNIWAFAAWDQKAWERIRPIKIDDAVAEGANWVVDDSCPIPPRYDRPYDVEAYSRWITAMVERYDGDGVDDMPGLKIPIKFWETLNEPYTPNFWVPTPVTSHKSFAEITKVSYLAAKKADPECKIVLAEANERFYRAIMDLGKKDGQQYFDIVTLHRGGGGRGQSAPLDPSSWKNLKGLEKLKKLMEEYKIEADIWFTEFGSLEFVDSAEPPPYPIPEVKTSFSDEYIKPPYPKGIQQPPIIDSSVFQEQEIPELSQPSPRRQAATLLKSATIAFYKGVDMIFLRGFGPIRPPGVKLTKPLPESYGNYSPTCVLDREGKPRPVYYTVQLFMEKLDMFKKIEKLDLGKDVEAYKYIMDPKFKPESEFLYVLWSDTGASVTLTGLENSFVTAIDTVLVSRRRFKVRCVKVVSGEVKLRLSEEPIIVEP